MTLRPCTMPAILGMLAAAGLARGETPAARTVEFNRDVRPILSNNCFQCHGPDKGKRKNTEKAE